LNARWLADDNNYVHNNHGIMMDRALLDVFVQYRKLGLDLSEADLWRFKAVCRLNYMMGRAFDTQGCCTENSPSYHILNVALFNAVGQYAKRNSIFGLKEKYEVQLKKAIKAVAYQVHEDGSIPLIGDSFKRTTVFLPDEWHKKIFGNGLYKQAGLCFVKRQSFFFPLNAVGKRLFTDTLMIRV
jgi:hypothetical protein